MNIAEIYVHFKQVINYIEFKADLVSQDKEVKIRTGTSHDICKLHPTV